MVLRLGILMAEYFSNGGRSIGFVVPVRCKSISGLVLEISKALSPAREFVPLRLWSGIN